MHTILVVLVIRCRSLDGWLEVNHIVVWQLHQQVKDSLENGSLPRIMDGTCSLQKS